MNPDRVKALYDICHAYEITTKVRNMKFIHVVAEDGSITQTVPYTEDGAQVFLYSKTDRLVWEAKNGRHYTDSIPYESKSSVYELRYLDMCKRYINGMRLRRQEEEVEELTLEIANTRSITPQVKESVVNEFYQVCLAQQYIAEGGIGYAKELLEKALGADKAMDVIGKLTASLQVKPFEFIRKAEASQLLNFIQDEHPQTIALILSHLPLSQAAIIVSSLPPDRQADVAKRIALMDRTSPDVVKEVEKVLESKLSSLVNQDYTIIGGVDAVVDILNAVDRSTEKHIMETLEIE